MAEAERPDLVLLDVRMPVCDGLTALPRLTPVAPVVMLTYSDEADVVARAFELGARGYLVHGRISEEHLAAALRACTDGGTVLGPGVVEILLESGSGRAGVITSAGVGGGARRPAGRQGGRGGRGGRTRRSARAAGQGGAADRP